MVNYSIYSVGFIKKLYNLRRIITMKKVLSIVISFLMILGNVCISSAYDNFNAQNKDMYQKYMTLLDKKTIILEDRISINNIEYLIEPERTKDINNFKSLLNISTGKSEKEIIDLEENDNLASIIVKDNTTNGLLYYESEKESNQMLFVVNGDEYIIEKTYDEVRVISPNLDELVISKTYYQSDTITNENNALRAANYRDYPYSLSNDSSYTKDVGPLKATNKDIFKVFDAIALSTGGYSLSGKHPVLGVISFVCSAISYAGNNWQGTFYIRSWRAYEKNVPTYPLTRSKERWYSESSCENKYFIKNHTSYFHSTRPPL